MYRGDKGKGWFWNENGGKYNGNRFNGNVSGKAVSGTAAGHDSGQTVPVKILISDDGSDDGTREMLENYAGWYPEQVFLHHRTQHTGGAARKLFLADAGGSEG